MRQRVDAREHRLLIADAVLDARRLQVHIDALGEALQAFRFRLAGFDGVGRRGVKALQSFYCEGAGGSSLARLPSVTCGTFL
jgi:hypothetical protein